MLLQAESFNGRINPVRTDIARCTGKPVRKPVTKPRICFTGTITYLCPYCGRISDYVIRPPIWKITCHHAPCKRTVALKFVMLETAALVSKRSQLPADTVMPPDALRANQPPFDCQFAHTTEPFDPQECEDLPSAPVAEPDYFPLAGLDSIHPRPGTPIHELIALESDS